MSKDRPIIDRIIFNRLVAIITSFILGILKIISANTEKNNNVVPPPKFPWIKKKLDKIKGD